MVSIAAREMTKTQLIARAREISSEAGVLDGLHAYFDMSFSRLYRTCELFDLFDLTLGDVLEIGPFYGYLPFFLRPNATSYTVLEGNDPAAYPLQPLYQRHDIQMRFIDFFDLFGPVAGTSHALPIPDAQYDTVLCWETMEHFNFNPVKFVRELHRVLKPGGKVYITVPNKASFPALVALLFGRGEQRLIDSCYTYENYESNGKKCFYGFHWREYSHVEMARLFALAGFKINACGTFTAFQGHANLSFGRHLLRALSRSLARVLPRYGTNVYLVAEKPLSAP
jgi:SAM-dependent methyltransferase